MSPQAPSNPSQIILSYHDKTLVLACPFFEQAEPNWLATETLPQLPLEVLSPVQLAPLSYQGPSLPILYGSPQLTVSETTIHIHWDLLGTCFFLLSRYEESVTSTRDPHQRFPASASIAYQAQFLNRPLVDEYVEVLWLAIKKLWPHCERLPRQASISVTCDVDLPYEHYVHNSKAFFRTLAREVIKNQNFPEAFRKTQNFWASKKENYTFDLYDRFDWMMHLNEKVGNQMTFYFIVDKKSEVDGFYRIQEPRIRKLLRNIHQRGHKIGLHGSYHSYNQFEQIKKEKKLLLQILQEEGITATQLRSRQHYLRWETPTTAENLSAAGFDFDSTLGFADHPGFRCGTSHAFPMYSVKSRQDLTISEQPLILMEGSVFAQAYLNLDYSEKTLETMLDYKKQCQKFNGCFTFLWHNSSFLHPEDAEFYQTLIA